MSPQYWGAADPVFTIMGDLVAAWNNPEQYQRWLEEQNGIEHLQRAYAKVDLKLLGYMVSPMESLVGTTALGNLQDFIGQRIRTPPGMVHDYFKALGAKPRLIAIDKVSSALERGQIKIADYSNPMVNLQVGLHRISKHSNYPGFHSMPLLDFVVSAHAWQDLSAQHQSMLLKHIKQLQSDLNQVYQQQLSSMLKNMQLEHVNLYRWSTAERIRARQLAVPIWDNFATKSREAAALIDSLKRWLVKIGNL